MSHRTHEDCRLGELSLMAGFSFKVAWVLWKNYNPYNLYSTNLLLTLTHCTLQNVCILFDV